MTRERGRRPGRVKSPDTGSCEQLLRTMPAWAEGLIPPDLVFDVSMRRRVLARVPQVLARESRRRVVYALRLAAVAAMVLIMMGGVVIDLRAQVPPVVEEVPGARGLLMSARAPGEGSEVQAGGASRPAAVPGAGSAPTPGGAGQVTASDRTPEGGWYSAKAAPARVRRVPVLGSTTAQENAAAGTVQMGGLARPAGLAAAPDVQEVRLAEPLAYAGAVSGQAVVVTGTGRVWRYVEGSLVGGENLLPAAGGSGSLVLLPGDETPQALWVDGTGALRLNGQPAAVSLPGPIRRLAALPGGSGVSTVLAAGTMRQQEGYQARLWLLAWQHSGLDTEELAGPPYRASVDPDLVDLAGFQGERGLTVYLTVRAGQEQVSYLGEGRDGRLRWRKLAAPLFRPGTAVSSGAILAGVDPAGEVAVLEWVPRGGMAAWFRPGLYRVRRLAFPEMGEALRSVHFFDSDGTGQEGLLLVGEAGTVGYVDASLVSRR